MRRRILLSDDMVEARLQEHERLQYALTLKGPIMFWQAEVIGPFDSPYFGRSANATTPDNAVKRLKEQLERNGFIGRLVEGPTIGRIHTADIIGRDYSDDDLLADDYVTGLD